MAFFSYAHSIAPQAHLRLYTDGDYLSPSLLLALASSGLSELRLSVKPDEPNAYAEGLKKLALAQEYIPAVMVEMPVLPYMVPEMRDFLKKLDEMSVFGVNLLELGYPFNAWGPFAERGLCLKNPPFAVSYDYSYAGGLPVAGSELACLYLLEFALDEGMEMGVHYCSLENKNRMQIYFQNTQVALSDDVWEFDGDDFFWKTIKLFDGDAADAVSALENLGVPWEEEDEGVLRVHPRHRALLLDLGTVPALSWNVIEESSNGWLIREVALELPDNL